MSSTCSEVENMIVTSNYYEFIKQMFEDLTKYIKYYKSITSEYLKNFNKCKKIFTKIVRPWGGKSEFQKYKNYSYFIINMQNSKSNRTTNNKFKYFINDIESSLKSFDKRIKERNTSTAKYQTEYEDARNNLFKKYKEIEKLKINYLSNISTTKNIIYKYLRCNR